MTKTNITKRESEASHSSDKRERYMKKYRGLNIVESTGDNDIRYWTIINPENDAHVHTSTFDRAKSICRCHDFISKCGVAPKGYNLRVRDKALKLCGFNIRFLNK